MLTEKSLSRLGKDQYHIIEWNILIISGEPGVCDIKLYDMHYKNHDHALGALRITVVTGVKKVDGPLFPKCKKGKFVKKQTYDGYKFFCVEPKTGKEVPCK